MSYKIIKRIGDYKESHQFPTEKDMRRFKVKQEPGYWYDWEKCESNDPNFCNLQAGSVIITDGETGDEIERVQFCHTGTGYIEYLVWAEEDQYAGMIISNRRHFVEERAVVEDMEKTWRDKEPLL